MKSDKQNTEFSNFLSGIATSFPQFGQTVMQETLSEFYSTLKYHYSIRSNVVTSKNNKVVLALFLLFRYSVFQYLICSFMQNVIKNIL